MFIFRTNYQIDLNINYLWYGIMAKKGAKQQVSKAVSNDEVQQGGDVTKAVVEPAAVVEAPVATENDVSKPTQKGGSGESGIVKKRTFKIKLENDKFCSRITGNTPKQAASKALTLLINQKKTQGKTVKGKIAFTIKETTRGSKGKEYTYMGEKVKLKQPTTYKIKSASGETKEIVNRFKNIIEKFQS